MTATRTIKRPAKPRPARITSAADVVTEREFQANVAEMATNFGWTLQHHWSERHSRAGWPDLTLCRGERLMFWELKQENRKPTPAQEEWLAKLALVAETNPGIHVACFRPSDMPRIRELLT